MSRPDWIPRLAAESVVVVLSILLALAADAWWEGRETRAAVEASLTSIQAEIAQNRARLQEVAPYHRSLADTLLSLSLSGAAQVPADLYERGWLVTPELTSAAWEGARATGATSDMSHETALRLSDVYQQQAQYMARREAIIPVLYESILERRDADLSSVYRPMAGIISDVASWEANLLTTFEQVLESWPDASGGAP